MDGFDVPVPTSDDLSEDGSPKSFHTTEDVYHSRNEALPNWSRPPSISLSSSSSNLSIVQSIEANIHRRSVSPSGSLASIIGTNDASGISIVSNEDRTVMNVNNKNVSWRNNNSSRQRNVSRSVAFNTTNNSNTFNSTEQIFTTEIIMSIVEGRGKAKGEIGLAFIDLQSPILHVAQFMDNYSFDSLKTEVNVSMPVEIIFPHTLTENNMMMASLVESFPNIDYRAFDRKFFNEKKGFNFIKTLSFHDYQWIDLQLENKYYCLAACSALFHYIINVKQIQYAPKSIKIIYQSSLNTLIIDPTSAKILELIINLSNHKSSETLFGTINRTRTKSGFFLLRSSILQPSTSLELINRRLDMIEAISSSIEIFNSFENVLMNFSAIDLDQLLVNLVQLPVHSSTSYVRQAEKKIDYVIHMKHAISLVEPLRQTLEQCDPNLFSDYIEILKDNQFVVIKDMIDQMINSTTKCMKGMNMKLEKCFAIKDRFNPLLDLARSIYSEIIDDIIALVQAYETKYHVEGIRIIYGNLKGFQMQIKQVKNRSTPKLPSIFKDVNVTKNHITFTTDDLMRLNNRIKQTVEEIYLQSDNIVTKLITDIRTQIPCLYNLTEVLANIDLVFSFAYQSSCCNYKRPSFSNYTEFINATHPVLDKMSSSVSNSIFLNEDLNFHIITGPNMSGKTTFLKQIALLQIMAQIGSFVPAEFSSFRICDKLFTRMALNDNLQMNSSSFVVEIKELNYILKNITSNSLILIDELGRDSSFDESFPAYWSICESLLLQGAFTIFATHFLELTTLANFYLNVTNHHFSSEMVENNNSVCKYPHVLLPGPTKERFYGIKLAKMSGLDEKIISYATKVSMEICNRKTSPIKFMGNEDSSFDHAEKIVECQAKYRIAAKLIHLISTGQEENINIDLLRRLQNDFEDIKQKLRE